MQRIFQDSEIKRLAGMCADLAHQLGDMHPASAFIQRAIFVVHGESRLHTEDGGFLLGAIELHLLEQRECLLRAICKARGVTLKNHHLDRLARSANLPFPNPPKGPPHEPISHYTRRPGE